MKDVRFLSVSNTRSCSRDRRSPSRGDATFFHPSLCSALNEQQDLCGHIAIEIGERLGTWRRSNTGAPVVHFRQRKPGDGLIRVFQSLPQLARRSITFDRGTEFTDWPYLQASIGISAIRNLPG